MTERTQYRPLRELLSELGLGEGHGIEDFVMLANEVQGIRGAHGVSRATGLFVIATLDDEVNEILRLAGFDRDKFGTELGVTLLDPAMSSGESPGDIGLRTRFETAIRDFATKNSNIQQIGNRELARAIVDSLDDWSRGTGLEGHLTQIGVDADDIPRLARSLALARQGLAIQGTAADLESWDMEAHVEQAVHVAAALAGQGAITARTALKAVLSVGQMSVSEAFDAFSDIVGRPLVLQTDPSRSHSVDFASVLLSPGLAESFVVAEPFLTDPPGMIWGRDFITLALTAENDPSLSELATDLGVDLDDLRSQWHDYVISDGKRRSSDRWSEWMSLGSLVARDDVRTFLFTWNPNRYPFSQFESQAVEAREKGHVVMGWSTGPRRSGVNPGDRVFLMRQGLEPRGLVGAGQIEEEPVERPHWDPDEASRGKKYHVAQVRWSVLRNTPVLLLEELVERFGEEELWHTRAGGRVLPSELADELSTAWSEALKLEAGTLPVAWVDTDAVPRIGTSDGHRLSDHDSLNASEQARTFATLLISNNVNPPFALGLLGDWGVGKTFFMRLMQENVDDVAGKDAPRRLSGAVSRVAQIEFNAWHYVDSDLWASLASHMFDALASEFVEKEKPQEEIRRKLRREIDSSVRERMEAEANIQAAAQRRQEAADKLRRARDRAARLETSRLERLWSAMVATHDGPDSGPVRGDLWVAKEKAQEVAKRLGITDSIDGMKQAEQVFEKLSDIRRRGAVLTTSLAADFTGIRAWLSGLAVFALVALVVAWPIILDSLEGLFGFQEQSARAFFEPLLRLGTVAAAAIVWVSKRLSSVNSALGYLEKIRAEMRNPRVPAEVRREEEDLREKIERLDTAMVKYKHCIRQADRQIADAEAEIQRIDAGGLVYDFLEGKVRDSRYLDRLGLISVIRKDFDRLRVLLADWHEHQKEAGNADSRPIERIILYIDDLDRCPPERVVEVLQAVHLLLAFDLFVVVVGVDARWLERSLNEAYNPFVTDPERVKTGRALHRFSAKNYLEKIFQIPYSLPVMDAAAYRSLVANMTAGPSPDRGRPPKSSIDETVPPLDEAGEGRLQAPDLLERGNESGVGLDREPRIASPGPRAPETEKEPTQRNELRRREQESEHAQSRIEATMLSPPEEEFISTLYPFIGTPRLAKRLLNIYRLLRVRASNRLEPFSAFVDRETGAYRAMLVALAIGVGRPEFGAQLLEQLPQVEGEESFRQWLSKQAALAEKKRAHLEQARIDSNRAVGLSEPVSTEERALVGRKLALEKLDQDLQSLTQVLDEAGAPPFDDRLESYRVWARDVGRYSFSWHGSGSEEVPWGDT